MPPSSIQIEIKRQPAPDQPAATERFAVAYRPGMNITSVLGEIALNPVTADGQQTTAVTYDSNCLEEICGSCAMRINGKAMMACSALVDKLLGSDGKGTIRLEPLSKFPVVRDLAVDRSVLFENLKRVKAWVPIDGTYDLGSGPKQFPQLQEELDPLSNCISCTICMEVCPQFNDVTNFVGAATIAREPEAVQHGPCRFGALKRRSAARIGRRWGRAGVRLRAELRAGLPEAVAADGSDQRYRARCVCAAGEGLLPEIREPHEKKPRAKRGFVLLGGIVPPGGLLRKDGALRIFLFVVVDAVLGTLGGFHCLTIQALAGWVCCVGGVPAGGFNCFVGGPSRSFGGI